MSDEERLLVSRRCLELALSWAKDYCASVAADTPPLVTALSFEDDVIAEVLTVTVRVRYGGVRDDSVRPDVVVGT